MRKPRETYCVRCQRWVRVLWWTDDVLWWTDDGTWVSKCCEDPVAPEETREVRGDE
jgi:hypothetical protein